MIHRPDLHHKFVVLFDIKNASPQDLSFLNGPQQLLQEVLYGLVLDEAIKKALNLYFERDALLPILDKWPNIEQVGVKALCERYYNLRMFGLTHPAGHALIPSPVRFSPARSIDPILPLTSGRNTAYGLYRMHGYYHPSAGLHNGVSASDLQWLWQGLSQVFVSEASSRPIQASTRGLWIFTHEAQQAAPIPAKALFGLVQTPALQSQATRFDDYTVTTPPPGHLEAIPSVYLTHLV